LLTAEARLRAPPEELNAKKTRTQYKDLATKSLSVGFTTEAHEVMFPEKLPLKRFWFCLVQSMFI